MDTANTVKMPIAAEAAPRAVVVLRPRTGMLELDMPEVWRYRELLYFLIWREIKVRYKQAAIGAGWAIIQPVLMVLIFSAVFGMFARIPSDGFPYPVFAFTAVLAWMYFSQALARCSTSLVDDSDLIRKIYFPRLILPFAAVVAPLVDLLLASPVLLALMLWYGVIPSANMLMLPFFVLLALLLALACGLWLGPINVRYRDIKHVIPFLIQVWMYASPVVYPVSMVPERWQLVYSLNPMVGVIEGFRWSFLGLGSPNLAAIAISTAAVLVLLTGGLRYFARTQRYFADVI